MDILPVPFSELNWVMQHRLNRKEIINNVYWFFFSLNRAIRNNEIYRSRINFVSLSFVQNSIKKSDFKRRMFPPYVKEVLRSPLWVFSPLSKLVSDSSTMETQNRLSFCFQSFFNKKLFDSIAFLLSLSGLKSGRDFIFFE